MKICCTCRINKEIKDFYKNKRSKDGIQNRCKICSKANGKKYWKQNKKTLEMKKKIYRIENKKEISDYNQVYYNQNRKEMIERWKRYRSKNRDKIRKYELKNLDKRASYEAKRRAIKNNATPKWANIKKIEMLYKKAKWLESLTGLKYEVDHVVPLKGKDVCGLHVWENLQILEKSINRIKSNNLKPIGL